MRVVLIPEEGAAKVISIPRDDERGSALEGLQGLVGGLIDALPFPDRSDATCYIHDESKFLYGPNEKATALLAPVLMRGDAIHGPLVVCGFDAALGQTMSIPDDLIDTLVGPEAGDMSKSDGMGC
jgi:hypothetical protein